MAGISLASNFDLGSQIPLDSRTVAADLTARDAIATAKRYQGLIVFVVSNTTNYQLGTGLTNADWVVLPSVASASSDSIINALIFG